MTTEDDIINTLIAQLRQEIDDYDKDIIEIIRLRTVKAAQIAKLKRSNNIPMVNGKREMDIFTKYANALGKFGKTMATALLISGRQAESDFKESDDDSDKEDRG